MTAADLEQKVRQLDNDVYAIYEMLSNIQITQRRHTNRFAEIGEDLLELKEKIGGHDKRFDEHDKRFDQHDKRFDQHDKRFDELDAKLDTVLELLQR